MKPLNTLSCLFAAALLVPAIGAEEPEKAEMRTLMTFDEGAEEPTWDAVNDGVMGGLSKGGPEVEDGELHFTGTLSLENNGGFSSVRVEEDYDLQGAEAMVLRVKGDGRTYNLRISTDARHRGSRIAYQAEFETEKGEWTEVRVPFEKLTPSHHGNDLDGPPLDLSDVKEVGILISDGKAGPFELKVDWMKVE